MIDVTSTPPDDWDSFVRDHPQGSAYHRGGAVRIGAVAFGLPTYFLAARSDEGRLVGCLPLVLQSSPLFGRYLISVPFFSYGGLLADEDAVVGALLDAAVRLASELKVDHVELRHSVAIPALSLRGRFDKVSMKLRLPESAGSLAQALGSKLRSQIRRGEKENPEFIWGHKELVGDFYPILAANYHSLGTPVYPRSFFEAACEGLGKDFSILVTRVRSSVEAAAFLVDHGDRIEVSWAAATDAAKRSSVNMRMYWEMLSRAIELGSGVFDFGRSTVDGGTYRFKAQWGAEPQQLHWHYWVRNGSGIPMLNQSDRKFAIAGAVWRRLPLWCANLLGPRLSRYLP